MLRWRGPAPDNRLQQMFAAPQESLMSKLPSISMNLAKTLPARESVAFQEMVKLVAITGSIPQDYFSDHVNPIPRV